MNRIVQSVIAVIVTMIMMMIILTRNVDPEA